MLAEPYSEQQCEFCRADLPQQRLPLQPPSPPQPAARRSRRGERGSNVGIYWISAGIVVVLLACVVSVWLGGDFDPRSLLALILLAGVLLRVLLGAHRLT